MKVSILIAAYRAADFLPLALQSVATQNYSNWELLVTEDGSEDGTRSIVQAFAVENSDHRIK